MKKYTVRYEREADGRWTAQGVEETGAITWGRTLAEAKRHAKEALEAILDVSLREEQLEHDVRLAAEVRKAIVRVHAVRERLKKDESEAARATQEAVKTLVKQAGYSNQDAGDLLGLSRQRIQQLRN